MVGRSGFRWLDGAEKAAATGDGRSPRASWNSALTTTIALRRVGVDAGADATGEAAAGAAAA
jgi:hypothetical protein